jgi:hypothetical protein
VRGASGARRVQIKVPESYKKVDEEVWEDLEEYLYVGFLTSPSHFLDKTFVFKTINHFELRNLEYLRPMRASPPEVRATFRASFIAHSVMMIDGVNALYERPKHIRKLVQIVSRIPPGLQDKIVENLGFLNARATRLHPLTEAYVHENRSRYKWMQLQSSSIHSPLSTGMAGTDELGMNYCQMTWTALNRFLDKKEDMEREWANAKFIGSCFNGKGVRSIDEKDRGRREKERQELEDLKMKVLYRYLNRIAGKDEDPPAKVKLPDGRMATVDRKHQADSVEELAEELSAALSGEKDHHDLVVEARDMQLRQRARQMEQHRMHLFSTPAILDSSERTHVSTGGSSRILGNKAQADAYLVRMRALQMENVERVKKFYGQDGSQSSDEPSEEGRKA